jgi:1,4-alpha-glucan branching enzyme
MPYVLSHGKSPHGTDWINESAAECYVPLLHVLDRLSKEGIKPRWSLSLTPILVEQLADESFKEDFEGYCRAKIEAAEGDLERFEAEGPLWMTGLAALWRRLYSRTLNQFRDRWGRDLVGAFRHFQDIGAIEIITSGATHGYLPLLGTDESCRAQIKLGVQTYERHFGRKPRGIWLPECAYRPAYAWKSPTADLEVPWQRKGIEELLAENGLEYFFVDSHMIRGGDPMGTYSDKFPQLAELFARSSRYFKQPTEFRHEYEHYVLHNGVTCFARDPETTVKVWSGDHGYPGDEFYLEFHKQLYPGRLRYWRISPQKQDLGAKQPYDPYAAFDRIAGHAADMVGTLKGALGYYRGLADREGTLVAMYDTELFGHWWWEGPQFLYELARAINADGAITPVTGSDVLDTDPPRHEISLPEGSWGEGGYHYVWLNQENMWTWRELYPAERRMRTMAQAWARGPAAEIVRQAGRELLLAESSDWQFQISTMAAKDYAEVRFADHIKRFNLLAEMAEQVHRGQRLTADDQVFLHECQQKDAAFPDLDVSLWEPDRGGAK